ncbi:tetratricopeptide repeat protein, partial [Nonomuraea sp. RK-328]|nr:tetratricopeptide repeat protein [Nonomuraea sp. RK-328]
MNHLGVVERQSNPYLGPRSFTTADHRWFFGRMREAREVAYHWRANPLTVLCGPSGIGKTSLLEAGVLPLLDAGPVDVLPTGRVLSSPPVPRTPRGEVNPYVFSVLSSWSPDTAPVDLAMSTIPLFLRRRPRRDDQYSDPIPTLVAVDRTEDLFADRDQGMVDDFLNQLAESLGQDPDLRVLLVLRGDRLATLKNRRNKPFKQAFEYFLDGLERGSASDAITGPLQGTGLAFADGAVGELVDRLLGIGGGAQAAEALSHVDPLLLQVVCSTLWQAVPPGSTEITREQVREVCAAGASVAAFCHRAIMEVAHEHTPETAESMRVRLRDGFIDPWGRRKKVPLGATETAGLPNATIEALAGRRILRLEKDPVGGLRCELSHDRVAQTIRDDAAGEVADHPADPAEYRLLANTALRRGDVDQALVYAQAVLDGCGPDMRRRVAALRLLAEIAHRGGRLDAAIEHYSALLQNLGVAAEVAEVLTVIGRIATAQGRFESALGYLEAASRRRPDDADIQAELAWAMWCGGQTNGAIDVLDTVLAREGDAVRALRTRGELMADLGRPKAALRDLARVDWARSPSTSSAYALAVALDGRVGEAMELAPPVDREQDGAVLLRVARVRELAGKSLDAVELARRALEDIAHPPLPRPLVAEAERIVQGHRP